MIKFLLYTYKLNAEKGRLIRITIYRIKQAFLICQNRYRIKQAFLIGPFPLYFQIQKLLDSFRSLSQFQIQSSKINL